MNRSHYAPQRRRWPGQVVAAMVLGCVLVGCGGSGDNAAGRGDAGGSGTAGTGVADGAAKQVGGEACDLVSDAEVTRAIGEHTAGEQDYSYGGCVWPSTYISEESGATWALRVSTGLTDAEFDSLFDPGEAVEPVGDLGPDATWNELDRELWFTCGDHHCIVSTVIDPASRARTNAIELARLLQERVS